MGVRGKLCVASVLLLAGCTTAGPPAAPEAGPTGGSGAAASEFGPTGASAAAVPTRCADRVVVAPLPEWARAGFSGDALIAHVLGDRGEIVAALFGHPLTANRGEGSSNKILWVASPAATPDAGTAPADLEITATLAGTDTTVVRKVAGGPGPSIVDLPRAGCWRLVLRWSGRTDTMDLVYAAG